MSDNKYGYWEKANYYTAPGMILSGTKRVEGKNMKADKNLVDWIKEDGSVLDFGCGIGRNTFALADKFKIMTYAYDFPNMIKLLEGDPRYENYSNITVFNTWGICRHLYVDAIFCCITLQHIDIPDIRNYLIDFLSMTDNLYVHGRSYSDFPVDGKKELLYPILMENWKVVDIYGNLTEDKISSLSDGTHYYVKLNPR
jgi:hypothetical protein